MIKMLNKPCEHNFVLLTKKAINTEELKDYGDKVNLVVFYCNRCLKMEVMDMDWIFSKYFN